MEEQWCHFPSVVRTWWGWPPGLAAPADSISEAMGGSQEEEAWICPQGVYRPCRGELRRTWARSPCQAHVGVTADPTSAHGGVSPVAPQQAERGGGRGRREEGQVWEPGCLLWDDPGVAQGVAQAAAS